MQSKAAACYPKGAGMLTDVRRGLTQEMKQTSLAQEVLHEDENESDEEYDDWFPDTSLTSATSSQLSEMDASDIRCIIQKQAKAIKQLKEQVVGYITTEWEREFKHEMTEMQLLKLSKDYTEQLDKIAGLETSLNNYVKLEKARQGVIPVYLPPISATHGVRKMPARLENAPPRDEVDSYSGW